MRRRAGLLVVAMATTLVLPVGLVRASGTPAEKCAAAKNKAAAKKASSKLKCNQKAIATGSPVSATCLTAAEMKFTTAITKAESKGGCAITGDGPTLEALVNKQVSDMVTFTPAALPVCCSGMGLCVYAAVDCSPITAGAAGTVCDAATGTCVAAPGTPGNCCSNPSGLSGGAANCIVGPGVTSSICSSTSGTTFDTHALCAPVPAKPASSPGPTCVRF